MTHHLRHGAKREWAEFAEKAEGADLRLTFEAKRNVSEMTLRLRHRDVRHAWAVGVNGREVGRLPQDENAMVSLFPIPAGVLGDGGNEMRVWCLEKGLQADDVIVGDVAIFDKTRADVVRKAGLEVSVVDADSGKPLPARVTIVDERGCLVPLGTESGKGLAVRAGVVYTATGEAGVRLPEGTYTVYAGRGFEWGVSSAMLEVRAGEVTKKRLAIRREVDTRGWVACDPHVHTWTYSRHGDATLAERVVTLAGEGIELPVATDHNLHVDYEAAAREAGVRAWFTPVIGSEVTTAKLGHFNVFPIASGAPLIDFRAPTWEKAFERIEAAAPNAVVVLNHARDIHSGFRPFDPTRHVSVTGEDLDGWVLRANAMEVVNSGATLNDPLVLFRDWMGCVNRGMKLTPVGASDSHDVSRFIVGQGRTYVRCDEVDPGAIDVNAAVEAFKRGEVRVSYGLLVGMAVNGRGGPGEVVRADGEVDVEVSVQGPGWTRAERVELYANGVKVREAAIGPEEGKRAGVKARVKWKLPRYSHDVFLTALAVGPGVGELYWPGAKPYQSTGERWTPCVMGCTGAVYLDADGSGAWESAHEYARRVVAGAKDLAGVVEGLKPYDAAVAAQAASVLRANKVVGSAEELERVEGASGGVADGFREYARAWRDSLVK